MYLKYFGIGLVLAIFYYIIKSKISNPRKAYSSHDLHDDEDLEVLAKSGHKLAAVKAYSKLHRVGLKEAKEAVDTMLRNEN